eukprot:gene12670-14978_t
MDSAEKSARLSASKLSVSSPALQRSASRDGKRRSSFLKNKSKSTGEETKTEELKADLSQSAHEPASATSPTTGDSGDPATDNRASEDCEKLDAVQAPCPNPEDVETVPTADLDGPESVLHFRNLVEQTVVIPNYSIPVTMDSEIFEGEMILMMRTDPPNKTFGPNFNNTKRLWWIQFQGKFKRPVDGDLYMGLEIDVFPQPGIMMRTFISVLLAFMKKIAGGRLFYQSSNNVVDTSRKKLGPESPFIVVPLAIGAGKITVTPPGEQEPKIGQPHDEDPEDYKYRQKTGQLRQGFNTDCVYTFSIYNAFVDFLGWTITNIPGCRPLDLNMMCQGRPFSIALYELDMEKTGKPHFSNFKTYMAKVQLQHERQMSPEELKEAQEQRQVLQSQAEKQHNEALLEIALQRMAEKDRDQREQMTRVSRAKSDVSEVVSEPASDEEYTSEAANSVDGSSHLTRSPAVTSSSARAITPRSRVQSDGSKTIQMHRKNTMLTPPSVPVTDATFETPATAPPVAKGKVSKLKDKMKDQGSKIKQHGSRLKDGVGGLARGTKAKFGDFKEKLGDTGEMLFDKAKEKVTKQRDRIRRVRRNGIRRRSSVEVKEVWSEDESPEIVGFDEQHNRFLGYSRSTKKGYEST